MSNIHFKKDLYLLTPHKFQSEKKSSPCLTTNNTNYSTNKSNKHIIINSDYNTKRVPNLIKNIHHKPKVAISNDNLRYQPLTSFEQKLSKQLNRLSNNYTQIKNRKFFVKSRSEALYLEKKLVGVHLKYINTYCLWLIKVGTQLKLPRLPLLKKTIRKDRGHINR